MDDPIMKARQYYLMMNDATATPEALERYENGILNNLQKAGADFSALDPKGERSDSEIREEVKGWIKAPHIAKAQQFYYALETARSPDLAEHYRDTIKTSLRKAGVGFAALDPSGEKGEHTLKLEIDRAVDKLTKSGPGAGKGR